MVGTFWSSTWSFPFSQRRTKSKQPKQHEINRKLLIKCFWGNDKTALWTYRFACVAQYLPSEFLKSRAGEKQFVPVVTGKVRKGDDPCPRANTLPILSHRSGSLQSYALSNSERLSSINVKKNSFHLQNCWARATAHDSFYLCTLSRRKINQLYRVPLTENSIYHLLTSTSTAVKGKMKNAQFMPYVIFILSSLFATSIINENSQEQLWQKTTVTSQSTQTFPQLTTNNLKSSEIVQVSDKRIRKRKSSFLTQIGIQTTSQCFTGTVYRTQANRNSLQSGWTLFILALILQINPQVVRGAAFISRQN